MLTKAMLTSKRFYFIRAWYEWIADNRLTAHIIVDAGYPGVCVPEDFIENGRITLNVSPQAINRLQTTPNTWEFEADFDEPLGLFSIVVPVKAIIAIYAQENKQGAFFLEDEEDAQQDLIKSKQSSDKTLPYFTVVEDGITEK